jgi:hypothetical protein
MQYWPLLVILTLSVLAYFLVRSGTRIPPVIEKPFSRVLSFTWIASSLRWFYRGIRQAIDFISVILEGEAGILWAFLILVLLLSVFFGVSSIGAGQ